MKTSALAPTIKIAESLCAWNSLVRETYEDFEVCGSEKPRFFGRIRKLCFGDASAICTSAAAHAVEKRHLSKSNFLLIRYQVSGRTLIICEGSRRIVERGEAIVLDPSNCFRMDFDEPFKTVTLIVPREFANAHAPLSMQTFAQPLWDKSNFSGLMIHFLQCISNSSDLNRSVAEAMLRSFLNLVESSYVSRAPVLERDAVLQKRIYDCVELYYSMSNFSSAGLADKLSMSMRVLQRLCKDRGTTPGNIINAKRLQAARKLLQEQPSRTITEIAFSCGFNDMSYFSRKYKTLFKETPRSTRLNRKWAII
jgi:AraC-like DNA-binding protein